MENKYPVSPSIRASNVDNGQHAVTSMDSQMSWAQDINKNHQTSTVSNIKTLLSSYKQSLLPLTENIPFWGNNNGFSQMKSIGTNLISINENSDIQNEYINCNSPLPSLQENNQHITQQSSLNQNTYKSLNSDNKTNTNNVIKKSEQQGCLIATNEEWIMLWKELNVDLSKFDIYAALYDNLCNLSCSSNLNNSIVSKLSCQVFDNFMSSISIVKVPYLKSVASAFTGCDSIDLIQFGRLMALLDAETPHGLGLTCGTLRLRLIFSYYDSNRKGAWNIEDYNQFKYDLQTNNLQSSSVFTSPNTIEEAFTLAEKYSHLVEKTPQYLLLKHFLTLVDMQHIRGTSRLLRVRLFRPMSSQPLISIDNLSTLLSRKPENISLLTNRIATNSSICQNGNLTYRINPYQPNVSETSISINNGGNITSRPNTCVYKPQPLIASIKANHRIMHYPQYNNTLWENQSLSSINSMYNRNLSQQLHNRFIKAPKPALAIHSGINNNWPSYINGPVPIYSRAVSSYVSYSNLQMGSRIPTESNENPNIYNPYFMPLPPTPYDMAYDLAPNKNYPFNSSYFINLMEVPKLNMGSTQEQIHDRTNLNYAPPARFLGEISYEYHHKEFFDKLNISSVTNLHDLPVLTQHWNDFPPFLQNSIADDKSESVKSQNNILTNRTFSNVNNCPTPIITNKKHEIKNNSNNFNNLTNCNQVENDKKKYNKYYNELNSSNLAGEKNFLNFFTDINKNMEKTLTKHKSMAVGRHQANKGLMLSDLQESANVVIEEFSKNYSNSSELINNSVRKCSNNENITKGIPTLKLKLGSNNIPRLNISKVKEIEEIDAKVEANDEPLTFKTSRVQTRMEPHCEKIPSELQALISSRLKNGGLTTRRRSELHKGNVLFPSLEAIRSEPCTKLSNIEIDSLISGINVMKSRRKLCEDEINEGLSPKQYIFLFLLERRYGISRLAESPLYMNPKKYVSVLECMYQRLDECINKTEAASGENYYERLNSAFPWASMIIESIKDAKGINLLTATDVVLAYFHTKLTPDNVEENDSEETFLPSRVRSTIIERIKSIAIEALENDVFKYEIGQYSKNEKNCKINLNTSLEKLNKLQLPNDAADINKIQRNNEHTRLHTKFDLMHLEKSIAEERSLGNSMSSVISNKLETHHGSDALPVSKTPNVLCLGTTGPDLPRIGMSSTGTTGRYELGSGSARSPLWRNSNIMEEDGLILNQSSHRPLNFFKKCVSSIGIDDQGSRSLKQMDHSPLEKLPKRNTKLNGGENVEITEKDSLNESLQDKNHMFMNNTILEFISASNEKLISEYNNHIDDENTDKFSTIQTSSETDKVLPILADNKNNIKDLSMQKCTFNNPQQSIGFNSESEWKITEFSEHKETNNTHIVMSQCCIMPSKNNNTTNISRLPTSFTLEDIEFSNLLEAKASENITQTNSFKLQKNVKQGTSLVKKSIIASIQK